MAIPDPKLTAEAEAGAEGGQGGGQVVEPDADAGPEVKTRRRARRYRRGADPVWRAVAPAAAAAGGVQINVGDFCCPEYIAAMNQRITENWNANQGAAGTAVMKFTIQRDGTMTGDRGRSAQPQSGARPRVAPRARHDPAASAAAGGLHPADAHGLPFLRVQALMTSDPHSSPPLLSVGAAAALAAQAPQNPPAAAAGDAAAGRRLHATIIGAPGLPPKIAVPDFIALSQRRRDGGRGEDDRRRCSGTTSTSSASST